MLKKGFIALLFAPLLLVGCNMDNNDVNEETPMQDVERGVERGVNDVQDALTPDNKPYLEDNGDDTLVNPNNNNDVMNGNGAGRNGYTAPTEGNNDTRIDEKDGVDVIEEKPDNKVNDNVDNR
ncbi:hypothetical protein [Lysinibacillus sp. 54212]|uniref:hypothetical protein n=1 Tax=Lysinibacillus sp. 54212 TaxID=3119829 RepID=UPI002FC86C68